MICVAKKSKYISIYIILSSSIIQPRAARGLAKMSLKNVKSKSEMFKNHWLYKWRDPVLQNHRAELLRMANKAKELFSQLSYKGIAR